MTKVKVVKIDSDACGVAYMDDKPILVNGCLPDEEIDVIDLEDCNKYSVAKSYNIIKESYCRVVPQCKYYQECGGCSLQHATSEFEKNFKIKKVKDACKYIAKIEELVVDEFVESNLEYGYRNKMVFVVENFKCGMYSNSTKNFVEINECMLIDQELNRVYRVVASWVFDNKIQLNHIGLRRIGEKYSIVLIGDKRPRVEDLIIKLNELINDRYQLVFNRNDAKKDLITSDLELLYGQDVYDYKLGIKYPVSANAFYQVNDYISEKLYEYVSDMIEGDKIINAYSGAGLLSAILSKKAEAVYGVEIVKSAHINAESLKKNNNISNIYNVCGRAEIEIPKLLTRLDNVSIVLDPPRKGVDNKLLDILNSKVGVGKIIYISCSPNSLAKDLRRLGNYKIMKTVLFNMFPQTHHVETVMVLERKII